MDKAYFSMMSIGIGIAIFLGFILGVVIVNSYYSNQLVDCQAELGDCENELSSWYSPIKTIELIEKYQEFVSDEPCVEEEPPQEADSKFTGDIGVGENSFGGELKIDSFPYLESVTIKSDDNSIWYKYSDANEVFTGWYAYQKEEPSQGVLE